MVPEHDPVLGGVVRGIDELGCFSYDGRCFGRRVATEVVAREFRLCAGLKGEVLAYMLEKGFYLFRFLESKERDRVLNRPWVVNGQVVVVEPWRLGPFPSEGTISLAPV